MEQVMVKRITAIIMAVIAIVLIISTFFAGAESKIVGNWEMPMDNGSAFCVDFSNDGTGVRYEINNNGEIEGSRTFLYVVNDSGTLTMTYNMDSYTCRYEMSGDMLILDGQTFYNVSGSNPGTIVKWVLAIVLLISSCIISIGDIAKIKKKTDIVE